MNQPPIIRWTPKTVRILSLAVLATYLVCAALSLVRDRDGSSVLRRGDFPAFYSAAKIVQEKSGGNLYDFTLQTAVQHRYWPSLGARGALPFVYPPYTAVMLVPLASLSPAAAQGFFSLLMLLAFAGFLFFGKRLAPLLFRNPVASLAFFAAFLPLSVPILGGQNTALGLFFYASFLYWFSRGGRFEFMAGIFLGLWAYKPQYALPCLFLYLCAGRWRVVSGALPVLCVYLLAGFLASGPGWPAAWLGALRSYTSPEFTANSHSMVSLWGLAEASAKTAGSPGVIIAAAARTGTVIFAFLCAARFLKAWRIAGEIERREYLLTQGFLLGPALVFLSPHVLYYDLALVLLPCARFFSIRDDRSVALVILLDAGIFLLTGLGREAPVSPLSLAAAAAFVFVFLKTKSPAFRPQ